MILNLLLLRVQWFALNQDCSTGRLASQSCTCMSPRCIPLAGRLKTVVFDKTGTLTQNRMTVMHVWVDNETYLCPAGKNIPDLAVLKQTPADEPYYDESSPAFKRLLQVATLCNNAEFLTKNDDGSYMDLKAEMNNPNFNILKQAATGDASEQGC